MIQFIKIVLLLHIGLFCQLVYSTNTNQYCNLEKYCVADGSNTSTLHIGCPNNYNTLKSHYKVLKLKYNDRNYLINELNQFRSDVALGEIYASKMTSSSFSYMKKLKWNFELENLLKLMISKHSNNRFYCMSTDEDRKPIQLSMSFDRPQLFSIEKVFSLAIQEIKSKALQSYSLTNRNEIINWSQCYHPETWAFACAVGELNSTFNSNGKSMLIRCAFYGKRFKKSKDDFTYGELCSNCGTDGCSDLFPGLCGSDIVNKRGEKGDIGYPGLMGMPGPKGFRGDNGSKGTKGRPGIIGIPGQKGMIGAKGYIGAPGPPATKGEKGLPGKSAKPEDCPGMPGITGSKGANGLDGPRGVMGDIGLKGEPALLIKGEQGSPGLFYPGQKGDQGDIGDVGTLGLAGAQGLMGDRGDEVFNIDVRFSEIDSCITCTPGPQGLPGLPGLQGEPGESAHIEFSGTIVDKDITTRSYD